MRRLVRLVAPALVVISFAGCSSKDPPAQERRETQAPIAVAVAAAPLPAYEPKGSVGVAPFAPQLTAVDPLAHVAQNEIIPPRPFVYHVNRDGITITRFNDNAVVGTYAWPASVWITKPNGTIMEIPAPIGGWGDPVGMVVTYPTALELGNRAKEIPDLTPPATFVYAVMPHSGYEWTSAGDAALLQDPGVRDTLVPATSPDTESSILLQIIVDDPSFSAMRDPVAPVPPHVAGAILGHGAGQPVYDRKTSQVYVPNMPSGSLPDGLTSFVSVIRRIPDTVDATEPEIPGISKPVIRCGPQHPEGGIPVGKPQAFACYDPSGEHPIDDNEHVGAFGHLKEWDAEHGGDGGEGGRAAALALTPFQEQYVWEFRNLPDWLTPHHDKLSGQPDGILFGTPPTTGEWWAEARVHNLGDEFGVFSEWTPIRLLVTPNAEYLPIKAQFAAGVPVSWPLEGAGSCTPVGAPAWIDVVEVPNGCVVMGRAPFSGEYYEFTLPGFRELDYPEIPIVFGGNVIGAYGFVPLPEGVGLSGLAWHQVEKVPDPSTETAVLSLEYIGVEPSTGQLFHIVPPPGRPQPPNERPAETAITIDTVAAMGAPLLSKLLADRPDVALHLVGFGQVAVEADRDVFVAAVTDSTIADGVVMKVSGGVASTITVPGVQAQFLDLDSDLRPAILGVEPGQVDHGALWVTGTTSGNVAVVDTALGQVVESLSVPGASSLGNASLDFGTRYAYVAVPALTSAAIFGPVGSARPPMVPRIWSSEEVTWNRLFPGEFKLMATGDPIPSLELLGELPAGIGYVDNGDGTATLSGTPPVEAIEGDYAFTVIARNATGVYAQAFGISIDTPPTITSGAAATFYVGQAGSYTLTATGYPTPIIYTWGVGMPAGVELMDNEDGTASLRGVPAVAGTYTFEISATTDCPPDATQTFTLSVEDPTSKPGGGVAPLITSADTLTWPIIGAPFPPDAFTVTSIGAPVPALSVIGSLPFGVTFVDNGDSTGTIAGMPWDVGTYTFTIRAANGIGPDASQQFTMVVTLNETIMSAEPEQLAFEYTFGGAQPGPQALTLRTLGETLPYAAVTTSSWLVVTPTFGWIDGTAGTPVTVSVNTAGMAPGTYSGTVIVTSAGTEGPYATAAVSLTVSAVPLMAVTPSAMSFEYAIVDPALPSPQTVSLSSGGVPLSYTVSSSASWLVASRASGATPGTFRVSVSPSRLALGTYTGTLTVAAAGAVNGPQKIVVTLIKKATHWFDFSPRVGVALDVGSGPEGLAVNRKTHQVFINTSNEAAAEPAEASSDAAPAVPEPPNPAAGNAVFRFDPSTRTVAARVLVHSEGEYVAANSATGRVYHASQGTSEVVVIDGLQDKVLAYIPLVLKEGPYMPYQIAVDEKRNILYVGAKAPPVLDPVPVPGKPFKCKAVHEMPDDEYDCWNPGKVFVIDGETDEVVSWFFAGDDPEGVVFAAATGKVYASNEDDGSVTVAEGAKRDADGTVIPPRVLSTIIRGVPVPGWWQPTCDASNYCGERGQAALWPQRSRCNGIDDEAEEADKMAVDPLGNVYIIDDRYRVAKIDGHTDKVVKVLALEGFDCEREVPDGSNVLFRNTANNIAISAPVGHELTSCGLNGAIWRLFVTSEQDTVSIIDPFTMTLRQILTVPGAKELDAIATDPAMNRVFITDEDLGALWILEGKK